MAEIFMVQREFTGKMTQPSIVTKLSSLTLLLFFTNFGRPPSGARIPINQQNKVNISVFWIRQGFCHPKMPSRLGSIVRVPSSRSLPGRFRSYCVATKPKTEQNKKV
jgi:hypothetical protein